MPISDEAQAQLDALHDQMVEESMHRECSGCGLDHIQDAATEWQCICCGVWNDLAGEET